LIERSRSPTRSITWHRYDQYYLFIELDRAIKISYTKHYLAQGLRSWTSLDKLKNVTIRILHKGDDRCTTFDRTRLPSNVATNGPKFLHQLVNLKDHETQFIHGTKEGIKKPTNIA
jgi:hypothetical protein